MFALAIRQSNRLSFHDSRLLSRNFQSIVSDSLPRLGQLLHVGIPFEIQTSILGSIIISSAASFTAILRVELGLRVALARHFWR